DTRAGMADARRLITQLDTFRLQPGERAVNILDLEAGDARPGSATISVKTLVSPGWHRLGGREPRAGVRAQAATGRPQDRLGSTWAEPRRGSRRSRCKACDAHGGERGFCVFRRET